MFYKMKGCTSKNQLPTETTRSFFHFRLPLATKCSSQPAISSRCCKKPPSKHHGRFDRADDSIMYCRKATRHVNHNSNYLTVTKCVHSHHCHCTLFNHMTIQYCRSGRTMTTIMAIPMAIDNYCNRYLF